MRDEEEQKQVSWNIASDQAKHVFSLIKRSIAYYLNGDLGNWYWTLTALREMINYDLSETDKDALDKIEAEAKNYHYFWEIYKRRVQEGVNLKDKKNKKAKFTAVIRRYQRKIMDLLKQLGYFPDKEDRTHLGF